jgi:thymidylate kinase
MRLVDYRGHHCGNVHDNEGSAMNAKIITLEGIDGAGKSTLVKSLHEHFTAKGLRVRSTREPWELTKVDQNRFIAALEAAKGE